MNIDISKNYWLYLSPNVYISHDVNNIMLLYCTKSGKLLEIDDKSIINLIREIYEPINLGVIALPNDALSDSTILSFIETMIKDKMGGIIEIQKGETKPVNLLPILNLQNDVEKMLGKFTESLIGDNLISYLSELDIYLNSECTQNCTLCDDYYKQVRACCKSKNANTLKTEDIDSILSQIKYSSTKKINLLGGNLFLYPHIKELNEVLSRYEYEYHFWVHYKNIASCKQILDCGIDIKHLEITLPPPINKEEVFALIEEFKDCKIDITYHFLIESEEHYYTINDIVESTQLSNVTVQPIYDGANYDLFESNVFLDKEDIYSSVVSMQNIFCNQKLNSNYFGKLIIMSNGDVVANMNKTALGNICNNNIFEIIYKELTQNSAWRDVRKNSICSECMYQFLCPPTSNYEIALDRVNLCHVRG